MSEVCVFWDDAPDSAGIVRITRIHHQPARLDEATRARGVLLPAMPAVPEAPPARGCRWALRFRPATAEAWWEEERDPAFDPAISVAAFLLRFPATTRVQARQRRATDAILDDFWGLLEMAAQGNERIRPDDPAVTEGVQYLVSLGLLSEADAARVLTV